MTAPINNASPTNPIVGAEWMPTEGLNAEGVLAYCAARLNSLDDLIKSRFAEQTQRSTALKEAGQLIADLNLARNGINAKAEGPGQEQFHKDMGAVMANLFNRTTDPQVKVKIAEAFKVFTGNTLELDANGNAGAAQLDPKTCPLNKGVNPETNLPFIGAYDATQWQGFIGGAKTIQDNLTKDSELSMIQLQSVVSQRQQAVQMTTQLMATMNESMKQVLGNIR